MNPIGNNILPAYLGNYGLSYASNDNIPNRWTMNLIPYYPRNPPLTFFNTFGPMTYLFPNVVCTGIVVTRGSHNVQVYVMAPQVTIPTSRFSIKNLVPYFQLPTWNPPSWFNYFGGGIPMRGGGSPSHGSGRPPGGGSGPLKGGGGCEVTFHPSTPGSTRWLCMEAQMLLMKEEYKCNFGN